MEDILHQLTGRLSHYLQGFIYARWCRISSINSTAIILRSYRDLMFLDGFSAISGIPERVPFGFHVWNPHEFSLGKLGKVQHTCFG